MPLYLLDVGTVRPEDLAEFSVWIHRDTAKEADPQDADAEEIKFSIRPMSGYEIENAGNKTGLTKGRGRGDGQEVRTDGTSSLTHIAKVVVKIEPAPIGGDGQPKEKVTLDVIRGLPAWILMRITEHLDITKKDQTDQEKN